MACLLCEKYGITESSYKDMVRNGVISTTFPAYEDIYLHYKFCLSKNGNHSEDAVIQTANDKSVSRTTVYRVIKEFR